jgi:hypothetical protein
MVRWIFSFIPKPCEVVCGESAARVCTSQQFICTCYLSASFQPPHRTRASILGNHWPKVVLLPNFSFLIMLAYLLDHCTGQSQSSAPPLSMPPPNTAGVVTSTVSGQTTSQTYESASITNLATITSETSIDTTIAGAVFAGVMFAGGLAWLLPKPPPG